MSMLGGVSAQCTNWELINLMFPDSGYEDQCVWLVGIYVSKVWEDLFVRDRAGLDGDKFFGYLRFKYKAAQLGSRSYFGAIPGL